MRNDSKDNVDAGIGYGRQVARGDDRASRLDVSHPKIRLAFPSKIHLGSASPRCSWRK